jgi:hypothetical protein
MGYAGFTNPQFAAVESAAPRVYVGELSNFTVQPSRRHRPPDATHPDTPIDPSSHTASPGHPCTVSRLSGGITTDS